MDTTWAEEIERSFGDGPTPPPAATYLEAGRSAVRRRRLAAGAASVTAALVIGGLGWAALPGDAATDAGQVATDPSPSEAAPATPTVAPAPASPAEVPQALPEHLELMEGGPSVAALADGSLVHRAGWTVDRVELQPGSDDQARRWGVTAHPDAGGESEWMLLSWSSGGTSSAVYDPPRKRFATFDQWLASTLVEQQGGETPQIARVRKGALVAAPEVTVLQVVEAPAEAAAYGPVEDMVAARFRLVDGTEVFGLASPQGTTTVDPAVLETPTMAAFLRHLGAQGDSGEGLR